MPQSPILPADHDEVRFADLAGWTADDQAAALHAFLRHCEAPATNVANAAALGHLRRYLGGDVLADLCAQGRQGPDARSFFEHHFTPFRIRRDGFVTGYFEPEVPASPTRTDGYGVPLHAKPAGLEAVTADTRPADWPEHLTHGARIGGVLNELPDRGAIMDGALKDQGLELVWLQDPVDAYFIHVQGSARLRMRDGSILRIGYAGKTGHPYTGIGRLLVERGEGTPEEFTYSGLKAWLRANPGRRDAVFRENRSYIFFRKVTDVPAEAGPVGAARLPLVPGRSLAIDNRFVAYGLPVFVSSRFPDPDAPANAFRRLMVADDTGSAIRGPARGDVFIGSGRLAGAIAGGIRHTAEMTVLVPKAVSGMPDRMAE